MWLAGELARLDRAHGLKDDWLDRDQVAALPKWIASLRRSVATFEAMRTVIVAAPPTISQTEPVSLPVALPETSN